MADVDSVVYTTTERKVRKVKKTTKRRESHDQNAEVTITEVDSTQNNHHNAIEEYVLADDLKSPRRAARTFSQTVILSPQSLLFFFSFTYPKEHHACYMYLKKKKLDYLVCHLDSKTWVVRFHRNEQKIVLLELKDLKTRHLF